MSDPSTASNTHSSLESTTGDCPSSLDSSQLNTIINTVNLSQGSDTNSKDSNSLNEPGFSSTDTTNVDTEAIKSPLSGINTSLSSRTALLPWTVQNRTSLAACNLAGNEMFGSNENNLRPGEIVMRILFADFAQQAEKKIEGVMLESSEKQISKLLQRGEDSQFDQLLSALGSVAEHCLPSLLKALLAWHKRQISDSEIKNDIKKCDLDWNIIKSNSDLEIQLQRREAAVEFIFCLALLEILKQLPFHPGHEDIIKNIENLAFRHFKYRDGIQNSPNSYNVHIISDLYGEVVGTLAQSRFSSVRKRFMLELKELRAKEPSPHTTQSIISLLMGMKFFRVKMVPIEELEASFQFMYECGQYFQEVKDKDIKHALAGLFVEILVPVAAVSSLFLLNLQFHSLTFNFNFQAVKNEVNVPCVKNFVDLLYSQTLDACTKSKHRLALFPLVSFILFFTKKLLNLLTEARKHLLHTWSCSLSSQIIKIHKKSKFNGFPTILYQSIFKTRKKNTFLKCCPNHLFYKTK